MISMFPIELAAVSERESDWFGLLLLQSSSLPTIHYKPILVKGGHHGLLYSIFLPFQPIFLFLEVGTFWAENFDLFVPFPSRALPLCRQILPSDGNLHLDRPKKHRVVFQESVDHSF